MTVLLFILKILGIILLLILGILLLAIVLVLFHPVSYQVGGEIEEQTYVHGKISWLFRILSWRFSWDGKEFTSDFYLFGRKHKKKKTDEDFPKDDVFPENDFRNEEEYLWEEADSSKENNLKDTGSTDTRSEEKRQKQKDKPKHKDKPIWVRIKEKVVGMLRRTKNAMQNTQKMENAGIYTKL